MVPTSDNTHLLLLFVDPKNQKKMGSVVVECEVLHVDIQMQGDAWVDYRITYTRRCPRLWSVSELVWNSTPTEKIYYWGALEILWNIC